MKMFEPGLPESPAIQVTFQLLTVRRPPARLAGLCEQVIDHIGHLIDGMGFGYDRKQAFCSGSGHSLWIYVTRDRSNGSIRPNCTNLIGKLEATGTRHRQISDYQVEARGRFLKRCQC